MTLFSRFRDDVSGAFAPLFAVLLVPLIMIVGMAVDYGRVVYARTALQAVVDSTTLAVTSPKYTDQDSVEAAAERIFNAQLREKYGLELPTQLSVELGDDGKSVTVKANSSVKSTLLAAVGYPYTSIGARAKGMRGLDNSVEVALVLDTTNSMNVSGKLATLKTSANLMVDILTADGLDKVKFAVVPFANYVNVGMSNRGAPWLSNSNDYSTTNTTTSCTTPNTTCQTWVTQPKQTCVNVNCVPKQTCTTNDGVQTCKTTQQCQQQCTVTGTQQVCSVWNKGPQVCTPKTTTTNYYWSGCVQSRPAPNHLIDSNNGVPYPALMLTTKNQPCASPIVPLTTNKTVVKAAINALVANYETYVPAGLNWGWNVLSPTAPFTEGSPHDPNNRKPRKALVLMTDGENTKSLSGTMHSGNNTANANGLTTSLCNNIRAQNIEIFTIAFMVTIPATQNMLRSCATSTDNFFDATDAAALEAAFKKIAAQLQTPYLGQ